VNRLSRGMALLCVLMVPVLSSACALSPARAPQSSFFAQMQPLALDDMPVPAAMPERPKAAALTTPAGQFVVFDAAGAQRLIARDQVGEANTQIALECTAGFNTLSGAYDQLLMQAQEHERIYNRLGER
jgi:hypothetical protein